mgnify:CR=1 FL=1
MALVVIVDDQPTNRNIFARLAVSIDSDITVETFGAPLEALAWLHDHTPDLIVTDYKMPDLDGAQFIARLRQEPALADVPVVVITIFEDRSLRLRALSAGATDFLHSPVDHQEFVTRARNLLKLRRQQLQLADRAKVLKLRLEHSEQALRDSSERLGQVIDSVPSLIRATDLSGHLLFINSCQAGIIQADPATIAGVDAASVLGEDIGIRSNALDRRVIEHGRPIADVEEEFSDSTGAKRVFLTSKTPLRDATNTVIGVVTCGTDITERKLAEEHLYQLAHHDSLTDLPNRMLLRDRVRRAIVRARRGDSSFALHLIDLDGFKGVNDLLGHSAGDKFLKSVSQRLRAIVRERDVIARLGGDEFAILQTDVRAPEEAEMLAADVLRAISQPYMLQGERLTTSASIGITMHPNDGDDFEELLRKTDLAMYRAKGEGGDGYRFYATDMNTRARDSVTLDADLRAAIAKKQFLLMYQPQVDATTGAVIGAEALLRWRNGAGEIVAPGRFLPRAEENGLIVPINEWALWEACRNAKAWQELTDKPIRVGVNLSPVQFQRQDVPLLVAKVLAGTKLDPGLLDLELTENIVMQETHSVLVQLQQLQTLGVRISIDDFGTGYSSFSYIKRFPVNGLKIDQSFIRDITTDYNDGVIVKALINLGHSLNMQIVAEGVETAEQGEYLRQEGCDVLQGYYFGRPMPLAELHELIRQGTGLRRSA